MAPDKEKNKETFLSKLEKFTIPSILILTFTIGGSIAIAKQTLASHGDRLNTIEATLPKISSKVSEIEKVPVKYDEQIKSLKEELDKQQGETNQNIRDLRLSVEKNNELIIQALEKKR